MNYLSSLLVTGLGQVAQMLTAGSLTTSTVEVAEINEEKLNLEGFTSALRIAMFPFAQNARVKVEKYAFNFDFPEIMLGIDATAVKRTLMNIAWKDESGIGSKNLVKVKRIANIMLELFPPIPPQKDKPKADITKIYEFFIQGLECLAQRYFSKEALLSMKNIREIPDSATFDYDPSTDAPLSEKKAARAVQETINLITYYLQHRKEPSSQLDSIKQKIQQSYPPGLIAQFANGLELLKNTQGSVPIESRWNCRYEFLSLDVLVSGCLARFKQIRLDVSTIEPSKGKLEQDAKQTGGSTSSYEPEPVALPNRSLVNPNASEHSGKDKGKSQESAYPEEKAPLLDLSASVMESYSSNEKTTESLNAAKRTSKKK